MTVEIYDLDRKFLLDSYLLNVSLKAYTTTKAYTLIDGKNISALSALQHPKVRLPFLFRVPVSIQIWKVVCQVSFPLSENLSCRWNGTWKLVGKQLLMFVHTILSWLIDTVPMTVASQHEQLESYARQFLLRLQHNTLYREWCLRM